MNQRIFELIQAQNGFRGLLWTEEDKQEFAELIVRECCDMFVELRTRPADLAVKDVKKHFGVEE